jgi:DNA-binding NarL/FixJ family response regulator
MATIRIFVSYAREDKRWFQPDDQGGLIPWLEDSLRKHDVVFWHDKDLIPGNYTSRINEEIDKAQIALLLVSQAFLNSKYIEETELPLIKARKEQGKLEVVPILVASCDWDEDDFLRNFQILPGRPTPLIRFTNNEAEWDQVRFEILDALKKLVKLIRTTRVEPEIATAKESPNVSAAPPSAVKEPAGLSQYHKGHSCVCAKGQDPQQLSIRVVLVDDHPIVRAGIRETLKEIPGVQVVGEASDGREAIDLVKSQHPDVVFMDISMPSLNGLEASERILRAFPQVRVIILSRHTSEDYYLRSVRMGASGYLLKQAAGTELKVALQRAIGGEFYLSREMSIHLRDKLPLQQIARARSPVEQLTERQRDILQLIAEGQTTKAIALILKVSPKTVEYHRMQLMTRLNIFDIPELIRFAVQEGLVSQE